MSFNAFTLKHWKTIVRKLLRGRERGMAVGSINMRKHCVEHYFLIVKGSIEALKKARSAYFGIPFVSAYIDLYRNKFTNSRYFWMHLHFLDRKSGTVTSFNAGTRGFTPSYLERANIRASDFLVDIFVEFSLRLGLQQSDVITL